MVLARWLRGIALLIAEERPTDEYALFLDDGNEGRVQGTLSACVPIFWGYEDGGLFVLQSLRDARLCGTRWSR